MISIVANAEAEQIAAVRDAAKAMIDDDDETANLIGALACYGFNAVMYEAMGMAQSKGIL